MKYCDTIEDIKSKLKRMHLEFGDLMPYAIIQPQLLNKTKYKVYVCIHLYCTNSVVIEGSIS
jgi:hypothetical protein